MNNAQLMDCCAADSSGQKTSSASLADDEPGRRRLATCFKALADPTRLHLLTLIAASPGCQACICHLTGPVGLSQPTVSHHMRLLADAGLVTRQQRGKWAFYALEPTALHQLADQINQLAHK